MTSPDDIIFEARRWWRFVRPEADGCWMWTGALDKDGYGVFTSTIGRRAHRYSHWLHNGPLDPELEVDHTCGRRDCVNPEHLEQVTHDINIERAIRDQCKHGHPMTGSNLKVSIDGTTGRKRRTCRACNARNQREYQRRKKEKP